LANPDNEALLNRILEYNEDDCYAMAAIKRYFEHHHQKTLVTAEDRRIENHC
jgi:predicted RecB family nuclease